jgi:hypothetical protein
MAVATAKVKDITTSARRTPTRINLGISEKTPDYYFAVFPVLRSSGAELPIPIACSDPWGSASGEERERRREQDMAEREVVAAILSAVLTAHQKTAASDVAEAVKTYHACLDALQHFGELPPEARWSASSEHRRLTDEAARKA